MGARGPKPRHPDELKSRPVSIRLKPAVWARLEEERKKAEPERTLSQEIEARLWESLDFKEKVEERFGGELNHAVMLTIADGIEQIERNMVPCGTGSDPEKWFNDCFTFQEVRCFINTLLDYLCPKGEISPPNHLPEYAHKGMGEQAAILVLIHQQISVQLGEPMFNMAPYTQRFSAGGPIVAQLQRAGKSPLDEMMPGHRQRISSNRGSGK